jgi:hypothetical protein
MDTIYDWVTIALFAALVVLFLNRSVGEHVNEADPPIFVYLVAGVGFAVTNYLGNNGYDLLAIAVLLLTIAYSFHFLRPFQSTPPSS